MRAMGSAKASTHAVSRCGVAWVGALVWLLALLVCTAALSAPRTYRAKIDRVDAAEAPEVRVFVTFLSDQDSPVNPKLVDLYEVKIDGERVDRDDVELSIWREQDEGTDLIFIMPAIVGFPKTTLTAIGETIDAGGKALRGEDRAGLITYSRAVTVNAPLAADKGAIKTEYDQIDPKGVRPFMFSSIDKAITLLETSPEGRKRAIVYLGDGTDAGAIGVDELNRKLQETISRARDNGVLIWTIGHSPGGMTETARRTLMLLSRKTGATYREARSQRETTGELEAVIGEIIGQLVLVVDWDFEPQTQYRFEVSIQSENSNTVDTSPFKATIEEVKFDWLFWGIFSGVLCILLTVGTIATVVTVVWLRRRQARRDAEELLADLLVDRPSKCETCHRVQKPEWEACPFCAQGMEPLDGSHKEPVFVYDEEDRKLCNVCGRVQRPDWAACPFCAQGMEPLPEWVAIKEEEAMLTGNFDPEAMAAKAQAEAEEAAKLQQAAAAAAAADAAERSAKIAAGGSECPTCHRVMEPQWPECLYCASGLPPVKK